MPERYPGSEPDPMLPALYDIVRTLGGEQPPYSRENEARSLPAPGEAQGYITDPEMIELLEAGSQLLGPDALNRLLEANNPFNLPSWADDGNGNEVIDNYYGHRLFLREMPNYIAVARRAGLSLPQIEEMAMHLLTIEKYPGTPFDHSVLLFLTRALEASVTAEEQLTPRDLARLRSMITAATEYSVTRAGLNTYAVGREAGLGLDASLRIVEGHLATADSYQVGYYMWTLTDALRALNVGQVDPALTEEVFGVLEQGHPEYRRRSYTYLKDTLEILCPVRGLTPNEFMHALVNNLRTGLNFDDALTRIIEDGPALPTSKEQAMILASNLERDTYFSKHKGALKHAVLPYQTIRPLNDGLRDIERLTRANPRHGEVPAEGRWVFDHTTGTWYSLGGSTEYTPSGARHTSAAYDVSRLSDAPSIFHIHPEEFADGNADIYGFVFPSDSDYRSMATIITDADQPISPRSFISHPMGVTEFVFPNDPARIQEVAQGFQALRDALFNRFGNDRYEIEDAAKRMEEQTFIEIMVRDVNAHLPEGFAIKLHPRGVDLEQLIAEK